MNQNEPIFLNLYIRDTETRCKNIEKRWKLANYDVKKLMILLRKSSIFNSISFARFQLISR